MKKEIYIFGGLTLVGIVLSVLIVMKKKGKFKMGTDWVKPVVGTLTSPIGIRIDPVTGVKTETHNGQDIAVPIGTEVKAPKSGTIKSTTPSTEGGNQVIMVHGNGWFSGFAHLSKVLVKPSDVVKQGQVIALSGNSGAHTTGPHLHFTMKDEKGALLDPRDYVYKS